MSARIQRYHEVGASYLPTGPSIEDIHNTPQVTSSLLEHLEEKFPDKLPSPGSGTPLQDLWEAWGARKVIDHLRALHEKEQEKSNVPRAKAQASVPFGGPAAPG